MDAVAEFMAAFPQLKFGETPIWVHGDASGFQGSHLAEENSFAIVLRYLRGRYRNVILKARECNPSQRDRLERVAALCEYERYVVAAWCRNLINSHHQTQLKPGTWDILKPKDDTWTHYSDAVGYPLWDLTKAEDLENPLQKPILGVNKQI
jgi:hypothetical protein